MKYWKLLANKYHLVLLGMSILIIATLLSIKVGINCLNADEAAFGYNAYSLGETLRDEHGSFLPLRLESFSDNKLPLLAYAMVPFVKILGLNIFSVRLPTIILGSVFPLLFYILSYELFKKKNVAIISALVGSVSPWIIIFSRYAFEGVLATVLIVASVITLLKYSKNKKLKYFIFSMTFSFLALFSYHLSKSIVLLISIWAIIYIFKSTKTRRLISYFIVAIPLFLFLLTEIQYPASRITNLLFYKTPGFVMSITELNNEHPSRILHNKAVESIKTLSQSYLKHFSPEFLVTEGDSDNRFGMKGIEPISAIEYIFLGIGIYFLFKNKSEYRYAVLSFLLIAPISSSITWQEESLKRSFFMIVPIIIISSYGLYNFSLSFDKKIRFLILGIIFFIFAIMKIVSLDFYFNHYPKKTIAQYSMQCGYEELNNYISENYSKFDHFFITNKHGQPYIFSLFYLKYKPQSFQDNAEYTSPDEYGFSQVNGFDKITFRADPLDSISYDNFAYIGYPDDFNSTGITEKDVKIIGSDVNAIFWIYEHVASTKEE